MVVQRIAALQIVRWVICKGTSWYGDLVVEGKVYVNSGLFARWRALYIYMPALFVQGDYVSKL